MDHAILALGVVALVAVIVPIGEFEIFLEGFHIAVLEEVARLLPAEDVVGRAAPGSAREIEVALKELKEQRREVELPTFPGVLKDLLEEGLRLVAMEEVFLVGCFLVGVTGREHHALNAEGYHLVEELADMSRIGAVEEGRIGGDPG